jgi:hypothetical protein
MACQVLVCSLLFPNSFRLLIFPPISGKTVLASLAIEEAKKISGATVAFAYCKHYDESKKGFLHVAKAILSQLILQHDELVPHFYQELSKSGQVILSTDAMAKSLLEVAIKSRKAVYIIVDGLDEYSREDRKEICSWYQLTVEAVPSRDLGSLRCLFISQDDGHARKDLAKLAQIKIAPKNTAIDIRAFCASCRTRIEGKFGILARKDHDIIDVITARSKGLRPSYHINSTHDTKYRF